MFRCKEKKSPIKLIIIIALALGAVIGIAVASYYFIKKFKLKLALATPCDDCLADDCTDCDFAGDFEDASASDEDADA